MKNLLFLSAFAMIGFASCKKGNGDIATRNLLLDNFDEIHLQVDADVYVRQGPDRTITVTGEQEVIDRLDGSIRDNEWEIEFTRNMSDYEKLEIYITIPDIDKLRISGSGNIIGLNQFDVNDIDLEIDGSGIIEIDVDADEVDSKIDGSGDIRLSGFARRNFIDINGSGNVQSYSLVSDLVDIEIPGSGNAQVNAVDDLKVRITGSGNVSYRGNPNIDVVITGSGEVTQMP